MKLALLTTFAAVAALAWPAAAQDLPVIARGVLTGPDGQPTSGSVRVFVNEAMGRSSGRGRMKPIAEATAGADGQWVARGAVNAAARRQAAQGDGVVNLLVLAKTAAGDVVVPAPRVLTGPPTASAASGPSPDTSIDVSVPAEASQGAPPAQAAGGPKRASCEWVMSPSRIQYTRIGELHQSKNIRSTFSYAEEHHADTDIGGAISYGSSRGPWILKGSHHVGTSSGDAEDFAPRRGRFSRYLYTRFRYATLYLKGADCGRKQYVVVPTKFMGGTRYKPYDDAAPILDGSCAREPEDFKRPIAPGSTYTKSTARADTYTAGVSIFGAELSTTSGYSKHVVASFHNDQRARDTEWICGNGKEPHDAPVVYAG